MSVYEKPRREKTKEKDEDVEKWLDNLEIEEEEQKEKEVIQKPEVKEDTEIKIKIAEPKTEVITKVKSKEIQFQEIIPSWVNKPWMYIQPTVTGQLESWEDSWINLILDYCKIFTSHVINITELMKIHPFKNKSTSKSLTQPVMTNLFDTMTTKGLAKWLDGNRILVRIYYKTDDEWAQEIMEFLIDKGYAAELMTMHELENLNQEWSSIPRSELIIIFDILVDQNRAKWVDQNKESLTFSL